MAEQEAIKFNPEDVERNRMIMEASYRRMFGLNWQQAMQDPFMQGRVEGERRKEEERKLKERSRGIQVGRFGTGFDR